MLSTTMIYYEGWTTYNHGIWFAEKGKETPPSIKECFAKY